MSERAVSDVVSFVIVFGLILASSGIVLTLGHEQLTTLREQEQLDNAERAFVLLSQNFEELESSRSVIGGGELDLDRGTLAYANESEVHVNVTNAGVETTVPLGEVAYRADERAVVYEGGGVIRQERNGALMQTPPKFACMDDTALVSLVTLRSERTNQLTSGVAGVVGRLNETELIYPRNRTGTHGPGTTRVNVTVTSPRQETWNQFFEDQTGWSATDDPNTYACTGVEQVFVRRTVVNVTFTR
jgi:hypothetical protein